MFTLRRPSAARMEAFRAAQREAAFSYPFVGRSREAGAAPPGWVVDRTGVRLGAGAAGFGRAAAALRGWAMFQQGRVSSSPPEAPIAPGSVVTVLARAAGLWVLNACRVVYVVDEPERFGFGYGTLPAHVVRGEERFLVWRDRADDQVWFEVLAYSRPGHWLTWLGRPFVRRLQRRFGRDACAAMTRAMAPGPAPALVRPVAPGDGVPDV